MNALLSFCLRNRITVLIITAALTLLSLFVVTQLPVDVFPELKVPRVTIQTEAGGLSAEEVEQYVSIPIQSAMSGTTGVERVSSSSGAGLSFVWVDFDWDTDIYLARQIVSERLATVRSSLPAEVECELAPIVSVTGEIMLIAITGSVQSYPLDMRRIAEFELRNRLMSIPGVGQVTVLGGRMPEYQVLYDPEKMRQAGITLTDLKATVEASQSSIPAGYLEDVAGQELPVRQASRAASPEHLKRTLVPGHASGVLRLEDVADVRIDGDVAGQQGIRPNIFQLFSTYYGEDARLNTGPKGFTGEKYGGATYWDTEAYCLSVYMAIAGQEVARQLLLYRHMQLDGAYHNARQQGLKGALFPMVTFTGVECHNEWEITFEEIHRNGAIAHAIFNYATYTGDTDYMRDQGLDVLCGIARFYTDRVHFSKRKGLYMIHGVTGPNEYENNVNNNWYTNRIAAWSIALFVEQAGLATAQKREELGVTPQELAHMRDVVERMYLPEDKELGIFVQHDTFLDKELMPASDIPEDQRPINQHWSWDHILRSCFIKQADVLQGLYFLNHLYDVETIRRNFDFYEPMTVHESSLSPCVHSILAAQLGYREKAVEMYRRTARLDLDNINNDTEDGLHITSMAGSWLAIAHGFAGMRTVDGLSLSPFLPDGWAGYAYQFRYRGRVIRLSVKPGEAVLTLLEGEPLDIRLCGDARSLADEIRHAL